MQVEESRAEDSSESGPSKEKALSSCSSGINSLEGGAMKPNEGNESGEDAGEAHIPPKRHVARKSTKKRVVGIADSVSSDDAELQNGTQSLKESSADGRNKTELELNSEKENAEGSEEETSGEERLVEGSQKVEELKKTAKPRGRPPKNRETLQSEDTKDVEQPKTAKPRGRPPKAKEHHSNDEDPESKAEEMMEARSSSEEGRAGKVEGLSDEKTVTSGSGDTPLASPKRGRPPKAKSAKTGSEEETAKVARPRGRPPKPRDSQSGSEVEPTMSPRPRGRPPKRNSDGSIASPKRGRPPKVRLVESSTEEEGTVVRGRPPKAVQEGTALVSRKRGRTPKPKAKRGRPSKASLAQGGIVSPRRGRPPKGSGRRGRPPKASLVASPARPRGRPPKQPRPRGRPRKVPLSGSEGKKPATPGRHRQPKVKRKRGRPSKVKSADSGTKEEQIKSPRPRGRPKKMAESGTGESSEIEDPEVTASSGRESTEREFMSGSEAGMKEEVEPKLIAGPKRGRPPKGAKGTTEQETGQIKPAKTKGRPAKRKSTSTLGRGRPPKVRVTEGDTEGELEEESTEPTNSANPRRGRPPKAKPAESSLEEDCDDPTSGSPKRGRPLKAKQTNVSLEVHDGEPAATANPKRGRPPKAKEVEVSAEGEAWVEDQDQKNASPGAGSPQAEKEDGVVNKTSDGEETEEKEGVTIEVTGSESIGDSVEDEEDAKTKAGRRGRPPKVKAFNSGIGESGGEQKKRGRPPKAKGPEQA